MTMQPRFQRMIAFMRELERWGVDLLDPQSIDRIPHRHRQLLAIKYSDLDTDLITWHENDQTIPVNELFSAIQRK